ncbi:MAG: hypothetical protein GY906_37215 [bacterium]|nr:hypothetical protein [bacterium]
METQRIKDLLSDAEDKLAQAEDLVDEACLEAEPDSIDWNYLDYTRASVQAARSEVDDARGSDGMEHFKDEKTVV